MNYADFYSSAERMLIDSLLSLWFKGKSKEQAYMRKVLMEDEPLLAEPMFQSIFPWEEGKESFEDHARELGILTPSFVDALSSEKVAEDYRFPKDRHPYVHQTKSWKTMLSGKGKTIAVTSGTGSGKTECFMIPVLQDIVLRNEKDCVQAIFLYPLNALMNSQQKRIHAWCDALPGKVTYAIYNGDTEKSKKSQAFTDQFYPRLITRPQIRKTPPQVLFTNPTMLNYMLVRAEDKAILEKSQGKLRWILLDEAHTYTGSAASELALQLRRVLDAFNVTIDQVNFAVTSATIGDETDPKTEAKLKKFVSQLTGKPIDSIVVIGGKRVVPPLDSETAMNEIGDINRQFNTQITLKKITKVRNKLNTTPALSTSEIVKMLDVGMANDRLLSLRLINALGNKREGLYGEGSTSGALLPSRAHFFIRSVNGVYACVNDDCKRHHNYRLPIGSLTTYQNINCSECRSKMLEVVTCPSCGGPIVFGETSNSRGFRMHTNLIDLDLNPFFDEEDDLMALENEEEMKASKESEGFTKFFFAKPESKCLRRQAIEHLHVFDHNAGKIKPAPNDCDWKSVFKSLRHSERNTQLCPHCGNNLTDINYLRASATQMGRILSPLILDHAESIRTRDAETLYDGKKYITFTDNRQGSARSAMGINQDVERAWIRSSIFHRLADMRIDKIIPGGLSAEEEEMYKFLRENIHSLPSSFQDQLKLLELKKNGKSSVPDPDEINWSDLMNPLENNVEFKRLFRHLKDSRGNSKFFTSSSYLKALMIDQFGWIPKRANSLENMGFVRLVYPDLVKAKCPSVLGAHGCTDNDWRDYLKICLDYFIRGGKHYMISDEYNNFLTQTNFTMEIYPSNSDLRKGGKAVSKWPKLKFGKSGIMDSQSRLVLLLCAVLGYDRTDEFNAERIANINSVLGEAWNFLTSNILTPVDIDNHGYKLDLLGSKVKLQLIKEGYVCPVDNVIVDVNFKGYSPRLNGYIDKGNFDKFKISQKIEFPFFPFKSTEVSAGSVREWIDTNLNALLENGLYSDLHEGIYRKRPIFLAAEHSAQQSNDDLQKFEKDFNEGRLNILSCSTTMEMGVDIGGINEVVMNNVPPKSANYLQRAGRAGRRNESKAFAMTFCAPNPIGTHTWNHPSYPISHHTVTPLLKLESRQLVQRHINALFFSYFVIETGGFKVTSRINDFFIPIDGVSLLDSFLVYLDRIISITPDSLEDSYSKLVRGTALENESMGDAIYLTKKYISAIYKQVETLVTSFDKTLKFLEDTGGNGNAKAAIEIQRNNFLKTSLLPYLAENSFLPSAGIPTGLVECILDYGIKSEYPTMHLSQAISSYAPGSKVVKNEWVYEPNGIRMKSKYDNSSSRYIIQSCTNCGYTTINHGNAMTACPKCGRSNSMSGIKDISTSPDQRFTEVVEPAAFSVAYDSKPSRKMDTSPVDFLQPVLLEMDPWEQKTSSAKMTVRCSTTKSEILFYNRGRHGFGFAFCPYCGRMHSEKDMDSGKPVLAGHKHLSAGSLCPGGESNGSAIRRHVLLVGRYQTDFVEIKFFNAENRQIEDNETLYSLGVILSRKLTEMLGVNDGEIDFGYNPRNHSVFIYDTALGGAGYSTLFREYKDIVLDMAYETLKKCDCECSCIKCLIDRRSQWYLNYLNRQKALEWLELDRKSRIAPEEVVTNVPDAYAVTTDLGTEMSQLCRNQNIKSMRIFVDTDFGNWNPDCFPFIKLIKELEMSGVDVGFVVDEEINLMAIPTSERATILAVLFQHAFYHYDNSLTNSLIPLLEVVFTDGHRKLYFGKDISTPLSLKWGSGDIYVTETIMNLNYFAIDPSELLSTIPVEESSLMFDTRIVEDCDLDDIFLTIVRYKEDKWGLIKNNFHGKSVSIEYSDRYLHTPLGCMLLANMIASLQEELNVKIDRILISVTRPYGGSQFHDDNVEICADFRNNTVRNSFLRDAIEHLVGIIPTICDTGYIQHERSLSVQADDVELFIRPDAGISNGWKPFGRSNQGLTSLVFRNDWTKPLALYNQKKSGSGILYTISFNQISQ